MILEVSLGLNALLLLIIFSTLWIFHYQSNTERERVGDEKAYSQNWTDEELELLYKKINGDMGIKDYVLALIDNQYKQPATGKGWLTKEEEHINQVLIELERNVKNIK